MDPTVRGPSAVGHWCGVGVTHGGAGGGVMEKKEKEKEKIAQDDKGDVREVFVKLPTSYCSREPYPHHCTAPESTQRVSGEVLCRAVLQAPALHPCLCLLGVSQS